MTSDTYFLLLLFTNRLATCISCIELGSVCRPSVVWWLQRYTCSVEQTYTWTAFRFALHFWHCRHSHRFRQSRPKSSTGKIFAFNILISETVTCCVRLIHSFEEMSSKCIFLFSFLFRRGSPPKNKQTNKQTKNNNNNKTKTKTTTPPKKTKKNNTEPYVL